MRKLYLLNVGCADASVIRTAKYTFIIDCHNIKRYAHLLPDDKRIRGVFVTHQHEDHYSGLGYLKDQDYTIDHLVYSPYERRHNDQSVSISEWNEFNGYVDYFARQGSKLHKPYRQDYFDRPWWRTDDVSFEIVGPEEAIATRETRELHDACLVIQVTLGERVCLFTGDASDDSLSWIAQNTINFCDDILHASHHGSINGANLDFIKKCNAKYTVISTKSGVYDNVPHPTALKRYRNYTSRKVYRTDRAGSVEFRC
jgi:beta-lactamase superfamily II metal-dependent hydrolase